jgi:hypothetical protein
MSRNLLPSAITYLAGATQVKIAHLIKIELAASTPTARVYMYVTDYASSRVWDNQTYEAGKVTKVGQLRQTQGLTNYKLSVDVAGEFQEELDRALVDNNSSSYVGRQVEVLRAYLDEGGDIIPFDKDTNGPMQYFIGDISSINISENATTGSSTVTWECAGKFQDFELINGRITDDVAHRGLVSATDADVTAGSATQIGNQVPSSGAKKDSYKTDRGFQHANQTIEVVTRYTTNETRYKTKSSWFGFKTKVVETEVEVFNSLELGVTLAAKSLPKVYGVRKVPGIPVFLDVLKDDGLLYVVYAFCEGEVDSILNFYMDGVPLICSSALDGGNRVCLGNQSAGDTLSAYSALSAAPEVILTDSQYAKFSIHEDEYSLRSDYGIPLQPPIESARGRIAGTEHGDSFTITNDTGRRWVEVFHGLSGQSASSDLVAEALAGNFMGQQEWATRKYGSDWFANKHKYWDASCTLEDTCYVVFKMDVTEDTKIPVLEAVVSGKLVDTYNAQLTKSATPEYTLNPVWQLLDYITDPISGGALDIALVDIESFQHVAASLDVVTTSYSDAWLTYWRYLGWKVAPGTNTTEINGVLHDTQKTKMQSNAVVGTENTVTKNIQGMLKQFDGTINILGSKYHLSTETNDATISDITADEVIGVIKTTDLSSKNKWNSVQATIVNPAQGWGTTQINFFNQTFLDADNGVPKKGNISFTGITNYYTAREWAQVQLAKSRYSRELSFTTYYKYSYLFPNATVTFTYDRFGYDQKVFRVKTCTLKTDGLVTLVLEDYDESIYTEVASSDDTSGENTPALPSVLPPKGLEFVQLPSARFPSLALVDYPDVNGLLLWDTSAGSNILRYDVENWAADSAGYGVPLTDTLTDSAGQTKHFIKITGLLADNPYSFKVRTISHKGAASKWSISSTTLPAVTEAQYSPVQNFIATNTYDGQHFTGPELSVSWDAHSNSNVSDYSIEIYDKTATVLLRTEQLGYTNTTYTYTLNKNIEDYAANNSNAVGAYRGVTVFILASNSSGTIVSKRTKLI